MIYQLKFTPRVRETYAHLHSSVKQQVKEGFRFLSQNPHGGEPLRRELAEKWKLRVGRFRIIYRLESSRRAIVVVAVGHRRDVYISTNTISDKISRIS